MPYLGGSQDQNEFLTCIDAMQVIVDEYGEAVPIKFLGDFNAQPPQSNVTSNNWYKSKGFNTHSRLLRDFIVGNELSIVDFMFYQKTSYTYFNIPRTVRTWIDHVFSTNYDVCDINSCDIVSLDDGDVSDHIPIRILITLRIQLYNNTPPKETGHSDSLFTNWYKKLNNYEYCRILEEKLSNTPVLSVESICDKADIQTQVNNVFKPDLSQARDTKRFWWRLWTNNGKPREGEVYKCYKNVKKLFRKLSRQCAK